MQKDKINKIIDAYNSIYDEDVQSEALKHYDPEMGKKLLSKLPGGHGRYVKSLKTAHDHHIDMHDSHNSMVKKLNNHWSTKGNKQSRLHGEAAQAHKTAAGKIKKLITHAEKNKLVAHPKHETHKDADFSSYSAHSDSHKAIERDREESDHVHKDHTEKLAKSVASVSHKHNSKSKYGEHKNLKKWEKNFTPGFGRTRSDAATWS